MRRYFTIFICSLGFFFSLSAQETTVEVVVTAEGCADKLSMYIFDGSVFRAFQEAAGNDGNYVFTLPGGSHQFYYFGQDMNNLKPVVLGKEENVKIQEPCQGKQPFLIANSRINREYSSLKAAMNAWNKRSQSLNQSYRLALRGGDETAKQTAVDQLAALDAERVQQMDSLKTANVFLYRVLSLNTYLSYVNNGNDKYPNEILYFAGEFFKYADWEDPALNGHPWVFEAFKSYTTTLSQINLPQQQYHQLTDQALSPIVSGSGAHKLALSGILAVLRQKNHGSFPYYGRKFIAAFGDDDPIASANLQKEIDAVSSFSIGGEAPNFTQATPEGEDLSLHDLRGKVLLVDFWASWCGPCRRDNPQVVKMYNHYKDQGFEILSVSLDRTKDRWLQAIEQDNLEQWHHVSDLKGWQNAVAQMYKVSSIPHTMLIDAEGHIIARGLRGQALEAKLAEIFQ